MVRMIAAAALAALAMGCSRESSQEPGVMRPPIVLPEDAAARPAALDPAGVVTELYTPYLAGQNVPDVLNAAPWTDDLHALINKAITLGKDEPILDGDPIVDAQDWQISGLNVSADRPEAGRAKATAKFLNFGAPKEVQFDLVQIGARWRIDGIRSGDWDLRKQLAESIAAAEAAPKPAKPK